MNTPQSTNPQSAGETPNNNSHHSVYPVFFGVGCWNFGIQCQPSDEFSTEDYIANLRKKLETIASLNNLNIHPGPFTNSKKIDSQHAKKTDDGMAIFSNGIVRLIEFDLYIPLRIQNNLMPWEESDTGTENFRVHILNAYYSPVVFVELMNPQEPQVPSTALTVIRNYLRNECKKTRLAFTCVAPTPFHANFRVEPDPAQNNDDTFEFTAVNTRGYSKIAFRYNTSSFDSAQAAFKKLINEIDDELGIYYAMRDQNDTAYRNWHDIERLFSELIDRSDHTSGWQRIRNALLHGRSVQKLSIALARFQAQQISGESTMKRIFHNAYERNTPSYLKAYIEEELAECPTYPIGPVADLLGFFERRRAKGLELLVILAAAVIGGVTGSLLTILASQ